MAVQSALNLILPMKSPEDLQEVARVSPVSSAAASDSVTASTAVVTKLRITPFTRSRRCRTRGPCATVLGAGHRPGSERPDG